MLHRAVAGDTGIKQKPAERDGAQGHGSGHACPAQVSRIATIGKSHCLGTDWLDAYYTLDPERGQAFDQP